MLSDLKSLAERFRPIADDQTAVRQLAESHFSGADFPEINPLNPAVNTPDPMQALAIEFHNCTTGDMVRAVCDRVKARKS